MLTTGNGSTGSGEGPPVSLRVDAGQPLDSTIMAHQIRTISKQRLKGLLGYLEDSQLQDEVCAAIKEHLNLD